MESKNHDQEKMLIKFLSRKFQKKENSQRTKKNDQNCKTRIREENYEKLKRLTNLQSHSNSSIDEVLGSQKQGQLQKHTKNCRLRKDDKNKRAFQEQKETEDLNGLVNGAYGAHDTETQRHVCYLIDKLQQQSSQKLAVHFKMNQVHRSDEEFRKFKLEQEAIEDLYYRQKISKRNQAPGYIPQNENGEFSIQSRTNGTLSSNNNYQDIESASSKARSCHCGLNEIKTVQLKIPPSNTEIRVVVNQGKEKNEKPASKCFCSRNSSRPLYRPLTCKCNERNHQQSYQQNSYQHQSHQHNLSQESEIQYSTDRKVSSQYKEPAPWSSTLEGNRSQDEGRKTSKTKSLSAIDEVNEEKSKETTTLDQRPIQTSIDKTKSSSLNPFNFDENRVEEYKRESKLTPLDYFEESSAAQLQQKEEGTRKSSVNPFIFDENRIEEYEKDRETTPLDYFEETSFETLKADGVEIEKDEYIQISVTPS